MPIYIDAVPVCPICEEQCEELYYDRAGEICGCENCMKTRNAWEVLEETIANEEAVKGDMEYDRWKELSHE